MLDVYVPAGAAMMTDSNPYFTIKTNGLDGTIKSTQSMYVMEGFPGRVVVAMVLESNHSLRLGCPHTSHHVASQEGRHIINNIMHDFFSGLQII